MEESTIDAQSVSRLVAQAAADKKAQQLTVLDVDGKTSYCDRFVLCNGTNSRQVKSIAEHILKQAEEGGATCLGTEGMNSCRWVLIDLGDVVVHIFQDELRGYYDLDGLWVDAKRIPLNELGLSEADLPQIDPAIARWGAGAR